MTISRKAALSLLISVSLFAVIAISAFTNIFDFVETRFYNTSLAKSFAQETESDAKLIESFFADLEKSFANSLSEQAVRRSFMPNQSDEDIFDRSRIYGTLLESFGGLQSIRFVDLNGSRIHFSTYAPDILNQTRNSVSYRNYNQDPQNLPFEQVQAAATDSFKLIMDDTAERIIFAYPFFDSLDVYRGTALFTLSVRAIAERLVSENKLKIGEDVSVTSIPPGVVTGTPGTSKAEILGKVSAIWKDGIMSMSSFESSTGKKLALFSSKVEQGFFYGRLVDEQFFSFPQPMRMILLLSIFLTLFLAIFLSFNLKQDPMVIVQNRLKNLQISLIEQYYERKTEIDWAHWSRELEQRREEVRHEVKRGIKVNDEKKKDIDQLIDKSWDELLAAIGGNRMPGGLSGGINEEKLQTLLNRVLQSLPAGGLPAVAGAGASAPPQKTTEFTPVSFEPGAAPSDDDLVEELGDADEVEELEELEELGDTEGDGALDGVSEELEDLAEVESLEKVKAFEEADDLEELEEAGSGTEDYSAFGEIAEESEEESPSKPVESAEMTIDKVASHIEFEMVTNTDGDDMDDILGTELEIFSPFAFMADGDLRSKDEEPETAPAAKRGRKKAPTTGKATETEKKNQQQKENEQKKNRLTETVRTGTGGLLSRSRIYADDGEEAALVELHNDSGSPIMYEPFVFEENVEPEVLAGSTGLLATASSFRDVIVERDGVNFISEDAFMPNKETSGALDIEFKELVDSVMG